MVSHELNPLDREYRQPQDKPTINISFTSYLCSDAYRRSRRGRIHDGSKVNLIPQEDSMM